MIEIQCTSCHTRYRIDERVLPGEAPTFKCSRCGHVFTSEPGQIKSGVAPEPAARSDAERAENSRAPSQEAQKQHPYIRPVGTARPKPSPGREDLPTDAGSPEPDQRTSQSPGQNVRQDPTETRNSHPEVLKRSTDVSQAGEESGSEPLEDPTPSDPGHETGQPQGDMDASVPPRSKVAGPRPRKDSSGIGLDRSREDFAPRSDEEEQAQLAENLSFDFDDDDPRIEPEDEPQDDGLDSQWKVGDEAETNSEERSTGFANRPAKGSAGNPADDLNEEAGEGFAEEPVKGIARERAERPDPSEFASSRRRDPDESTFLSATRESVASLIKIPMDDGAERLLDRSRYHSAGWFLGLFFLVAVVFAGATMVISGTPASSARLLQNLPVIGSGMATQPALESKIALSDVHAYYQHINGKRLALVIAGEATSKAPAPLHVVELDVRVLGAGKQPLVTRSVYCGQTLSEKMISQMTPQELEFLQKLGPQKTFVLNPEHSAPFVTVFIDPPRNVKRFTVAVSKASREQVQTASNEKIFP